MLMTSKVALARGRTVGVSTRPTLYVSAISGCSFGLPPTGRLYWRAGFPGVPIAPYCAGERPLRWQAVGLAGAVEPEELAQGSTDPSRATTSCAKSSAMLGTRTARL